MPLPLVPLRLPLPLPCKFPRLLSLACINDPELVSLDDTNPVLDPNTCFPPCSPKPCSAPPNAPGVGRSKYSGMPFFVRCCWDAIASSCYLALASLRVMRSCAGTLQAGAGASACVALSWSFAALSLPGEALEGLLPRAPSSVIALWEKFRLPGPDTGPDTDPAPRPKPALARPPAPTLLRDTGADDPEWSSIGALTPGHPSGLLLGFDRTASIAFYSLLLPSASGGPAAGLEEIKLA